MFIGVHRRLRGFLAASLAAVCCDALAQVTPDQPEPAVARGGQGLATAKRAMVSAGHRLAADAGVRMLQRGGSAVDAMIAAQLVLTLVEPQSSGLGGGAFLLFFDGKSKRVLAYDGRETAPSAAAPDLFLSPGDKPMPFREAVVGGRSVGVPGTPRLLEVAHARHGRLAWATLFQPAIELAEQGFPVSPRLFRALERFPEIADQPGAGAYFFGPDRKPRAVGSLLRNPELAATLRLIAARGADAFYEGDVARDIVATVRGHPNAGSMSMEDLAGYRVRTVEALCGTYRERRLCGMPPSSSGGVAVLQMLGILSHFDMAGVRPGSTEAVHLFSEAGRLAYADRARYLGDDRFVDVPVKGLLDRGYLAGRAKLIEPHKSMGRAKVGTPPGLRTAFADDAVQEAAGTSQISVVDPRGNAVSMTTTIEAIFGSHLMVRGFMLNNELTDFNFEPVEAGRYTANAIAPGKRPRSSMAPFVVQDAASGRLEMVLGSPGGSYIINYVAKALVAMLDWKLDVQSAIALANFGSRNGPTELEKGTELERLEGALKAIGHEVRVIDMPSGLQAIRRAPGGWEAGSDPRREGAARGL